MTDMKKNHKVLKKNRLNQKVLKIYNLNKKVLPNDLDPKTDIKLIQISSVLIKQRADLKHLEKVNEKQPFPKVLNFNKKLISASKHSALKANILADESSSMSKNQKRKVANSLSVTKGATYNHLTPVTIPLDLKGSYSMTQKRKANDEDRSKPIGTKRKCVISNNSLSNNSLSNNILNSNSLSDNSLSDNSLSDTSLSHNSLSHYQDKPFNKLNQFTSLQEPIQKRTKTKLLENPDMFHRTSSERAHQPATKIKSNKNSVTELKDKNVRIQSNNKLVQSVGLKQQHLNETKTRSTIFRCYQCGMSFEQFPMCNDHIKMMHPNFTENNKQCEALTKNGKSEGQDLGSVEVEIPNNQLLAKNITKKVVNVSIASQSKHQISNFQIESKINSRILQSQQQCPKCKSSFLSKNIFRSHVGKCGRPKPSLKMDKQNQIKKPISNSPSKLEKIKPGGNMPKQIVKLQCNKCHQIFTNSFTLLKHICSKKSLSNLLSNLVRTKPEIEMPKQTIKFRCNQCHQKFTDRSSIFHHFQKVCPRMSVSELLASLGTDGDTKSQLKCDKCNSLFLHKLSLKRHINLLCSVKSNTTNVKSSTNLEEVVKKSKNSTRPECQNPSLEKAIKRSQTSESMQLKSQNIDTQKVVKETIFSRNKKQKCWNLTSGTVVKCNKNNIDGAKVKSQNLATQKIVKKLIVKKSKKEKCQNLTSRIDVRCNKTYDSLKSQNLDTQKKFKEAIVSKSKTEKCQNPISRTDVKCNKTNESAYEISQNIAKLEMVKEAVVSKTKEEKCSNLTTGKVSKRSKTDKSTHVNSQNLASKVVTGKIIAQLKCQICHKPFVHKQSLSRHNRQFHFSLQLPKKTEAVTTIEVDNPILHCAHCNVFFQNLKTLKTHKKNFHSKPFKCDNCELTFYQSSSLQNHVLKIHSLIKVKESVEKPQLTDDTVKVSLIQEQNKVKKIVIDFDEDDVAIIEDVDPSTSNLVPPSNGIHCSRCKKTFPTFLSVRLHKSECNSKRSLPFQCGHCTESFADVQFLQSHLASFHMSNNETVHQNSIKEFIPTSYENNAAIQKAAQKSTFLTLTQVNQQEADLSNEKEQAPAGCSSKNSSNLFNPKIAVPTTPEYVSNNSQDVEVVFSSMHQILTQSSTQYYSDSSI